MTPYTYKVTHISSGQWYYGVRYANGCDPSDLFVKYFTSSKDIQFLLNQDGPTAFRIEIRQKFLTKDAAIKWEATVLRKILNWPGCLNKSAWPAISSDARAQGNLTKLKIQEDGFTIAKKIGMTWKKRQHEIDLATGLTKRELRRQKYNLTMIRTGARDRVSAATKQRMKTNNPAKNKETRKKIAETLKRKIASGEISTTKGRKFQSISDKLRGNKFTKGKIWITNGKIDLRIDSLEQIPEGFIIGRSIANNRGHQYDNVTCPYCKKVGSGGNMKRYHFDNCKTNLQIVEVVL